MKNCADCFIFLLLLLTSTSAYTNLSPKQVHDRLVQNDTLLLVDVRETSEYRRGHLAEPAGQLPITPVNLPYNSGVFNTEYHRLPKDRDIVISCASGSRSAAAAAFLNGKGYSRVFNMTGGFSSWTFESRKDGYGDHSGKWIPFSAATVTTVFCVAGSDTSELFFPPGGLVGSDSMYVEMHRVDAQTPVPPGTPVSDVKGLFRITALDRYGFSKMTGDSLILAQAVEISLAPGYLVDKNSIAGTSAVMAFFVPGPGWQACENSYRSFRFLRTETVLRTWYSVSGFKGTGVVQNGVAEKRELITAYPNPFNGRINIIAPADAEIAVFDVRGRMVEKLNKRTWSPSAAIASGVYFIKIISNDGIGVRKISYVR